MKKLILLVVLGGLILGGMRLYRSFMRGGAAAETAVGEFHASLNAAEDGEIYDSASAALHSSVTKEKFHGFLFQIRKDMGLFKRGERQGLNISSMNGNTTIRVGFASDFEKGRAEESFVFDYNADKPVLLRYDIRKNIGSTANVP